MATRPDRTSFTIVAVVIVGVATMGQGQSPVVLPGAATVPGQTSSPGFDPPPAATFESLRSHPNALSHPVSAAAHDRQTMADPQHRVGAAGDYIGFSHVDGSGTWRIAVLHAGKSSLAVYHVDQSGAIRLQSSRPIDADFSLLLNGTDPLPDAIRQMELQSRSGRSR